MISDKAIIDKSAKIAANVEISPYAIIGPNVEIGEGTWIGPHVVVNGPTKIGRNNRIYQFASIGEAPQDKKYAGEPTRLEIGDNNIFRECTTVSRGTVPGGGLTKIGNDNLFMAYVHIAHDCMVGNNTTFSNNASLAGHVTVDDYANLGGFVGVHQFTNIGSYCFCAGGSMVVKDVIPFIMVSGNLAQAYGLNVEGLKRRQFTSEEIVVLKRAYKTLYRQGLTLEDAVHKLEAMIPECRHIPMLIDFIKKSTRGIIR
ncbi:MAG: acyl-ACP--UDP-N-acetylglucosamine O-acyltransferase [Gammaproteobacteria bacterium]|nr:acyl-ACP--UDP-N-acetylglucosamine O-acyltransferase [Gammaproteobacteria bacterium]